MRIDSRGKVVRLLIVTTMLPILVLPVPAAAAGRGPLIAPLADGIELSVTGRILKDVPSGVTLATVRGSSLVTVASPITLPSEAPARARVPRGTKFRVLVTAYSSTPDQTDSSPFITASGSVVRDGTAAANFLPFGAKVRFSGYRPGAVYTIEDRHSPRLSDRIDLWFPSRAAALDFGARVLVMEIVG